MSPNRLTGPKRLNGQAKAISAVRLEGWGIRFDLYSKTNNSAVTDIVPEREQHVMGVLFDVPEDAPAIMDKVEGVRADGMGNLPASECLSHARTDWREGDCRHYVGTESGRERFLKESD